MERLVITLTLAVVGLGLLLFNRRFTQYTVAELHRMTGMRFPELMYRISYFIIGVTFTVAGALSLIKLL